jgi:hypothetical protein
VPGHPPAVCTDSASNGVPANNQEIFTTVVDLGAIDHAR